MDHLSPDIALPDAPLPEARKRRRPLLWAALAVPVIAWTALFAGGAQAFRQPIERWASDALGRPVSIGGEIRVLVTPFSLYLTAGDVRVANPRWATDDHLLSAAIVKARLSTFDLLIGRHGLRSLDLRGGTLDLERSRQGGRINWAVGKAGTLLDMASVQRIDADDMTVRYRDFGTGTDAHAVLTSQGAGRISLSGRGMVDRRPFAFAGTAQSGDERPTRFDIAARTGGIRLGLQGTADSPLHLADAEVTASARGGNFAELAELAGVALPDMPDYILKARLGHAARAWHFGRIEGRIGQTDLAGKLTLDLRRDRPRIVGQLASRNLHMPDGMRLIGLWTDTPPPYPIDAAMTEEDMPVLLQARLLPDARISPDALQRFDAVIDYTANRVSGITQAPTQVAMKLALVRGVLNLSPVTIDLAGGFISSDILIDARHETAVARYDIRLSPTPMARLLGQWGVAPAGTTATVRGRIQLAGRGTTLRETLANADGRIAFVIPDGNVRTQRASTSPLDMANLNAAIFRTPQLGAADVSCGLIAFTVRGGLAEADPIMIDTAGHVLSGSGHIDLGNETLALRLSAQGKSFSFLSGPVPVTLGGTLADPLILRESPSWFRPANIFGLTVTLPDVAALLSFVDPGNAEAPACGPILRGAPAVAQRERKDRLAALP